MNSRSQNPHAGETTDRVIGALFGLAVGDAVGTALEFKKPGSFAPISDMVGGGPFQLEPGQWTDDTSMALCLAESLVERRGFDPIDQLQRYVSWWRKGHLSSTGACFDIGIQTQSALSEFERTGRAACGPTGPKAAGNGSLMRLAPIVMAYWRDPDEAIRRAADSSCTTHGNRVCQDACRYFAGLIAGAITGVPKNVLTTPGYSPNPGLWERMPLAPEVAQIATGSFLTRQPPDIRGTGYVVDSLEASLWAFATTRTYEAAVLRAANLGDDADTTAAICGQIAGAFYGRSSIPADWVDKLAHRRRISDLADALNTLSINLTS